MGSEAAGVRPGVHQVMATPFRPDESLDEASLPRLVDYAVAAGAAGVLVLGVMGEADRLADAERERVIGLTLATAGDRLQVTVGITHGATVVTRERARAAARAGATAVMVAPPPGSSAGPALCDHFVRIADGLPIPLVIQDHPPSSGVKLPVEFLARLSEHLPPGSVVKLEDVPAAPKIARLRELTDAYVIFGGLGGVSLLDELAAGDAGTMTGFALPEVLVEIVAAFLQGEVETARRICRDYLPLIVFEAQPGAGPALRKEILWRRGAIAHATVRQPAPLPDAFTLGTLDRLLNETTRRSDPSRETERRG
jgi:4-hydroxy-tetrahydrodipicolinate synthase